MTITCKKHYIVFFSPGTLFPEEEWREIDPDQLGDTEHAKTLSRDIVARYGARPHSFKFVVRGRASDDLDSKELSRSQTYFLGGRIVTLEEIEAMGDPQLSVLLSNMRGGEINRVLLNENSYRSFLRFQDGDVVLDYELEAT